MKTRRIHERVSWMGAVDWDRRLFDSLIPLPDGTSYNAYVIQGDQQTALLDTVDPGMKDVLLFQLEDVDRIDYVVAHHAEQDHAGTIPAVLEKYKDAKVVSTPKAKGMLIDLLCLPEERCMVVEDGETLSLGDKTLKFIYTPWVHWPETMVTYLQEDRMLFSCDFFGSHLATTDLYVTDEGRVYEAAKRYYAEIMMPFRKIIQKNIAKLDQYAIDVIAPSHGPMYSEPAFIMNAYRDWISDQPKNSVVLPYVSMHGSTQKMVEYMVSALAERGLTVHQFNLAVTDIGKLAITLVDAATILIGTPTVHVGPHPLVFYATHLANALRPKVKFASIIGSYGWSSKAIERIAGLIPNLDVEVLDPVLCRGYPRQTDFEALDTLASTIAEQHQAQGLLEAL
ncbi:MBL fold metallo-hydrolase [candidate division KSB3 bacterium]|uniref:MBL fold metallo-hydrolase n=1 Tax=candidate division KSB3 bacterium TaxID=2044937 RepID=A0A9D5JXH2_9BACT|nr:MBL fold metallo-hydrolase [candidate division KSB3 bacterium]MBD3325761.1 MBL fold metallo-hydrolase [candidate division KSB3 bacterium]